jgi:DNA-binding response OmpR family regulator
LPPIPVPRRNAAGAGAPGGNLLKRSEQKTVEYDPTIELLLVDDDLHVLAVLEDLFTTEKDINVTALSDSVEAIELIRNKKFDLVISDLKMPKKDGLDLTRTVQESQPEALVIIITGFASLETTLEAIHLGVYDYITKPFQIDEFQLLVSNASKRIRLERENCVLKSKLSALESDLGQLENVHSSLIAELDVMRQQLSPPERAENPAGRGAGSGRINVYQRMAGGTGARTAPSPPEAGPSAQGEQPGARQDAENG